mgnify:CR=1 FL=1
MISQIRCHKLFLLVAIVDCETKILFDYLLTLLPDDPGDFALAADQ